MTGKPDKELIDSHWGQINELHVAYAIILYMLVIEVYSPIQRRFSILVSFYLKIVFPIFINRSRGEIFQVPGGNFIEPGFYFLSCLAGLADTFPFTIYISYINSPFEFTRRGLGDTSFSFFSSSHFIIHPKSPYHLPLCFPSLLLE